MRSHVQHGDRSIAIYPGSFDPITNGHMDIIERATYLFDEVFVLVAVNPTKANKGLFDPETRVQLIKESLPEYLHGHVKVDYTRTLQATVDVCSKVGARAMIRGLRTVSDFDSEFSLAIANMGLAEHVETVFLVPKPENHFISSSRVREILQIRGPESVKDLVPDRVFEELAK
jgi:pantetheine-phosphate adenylyltransferase